jgi:hypothetical protein
MDIVYLKLILLLSDNFQKIRIFLIFGDSFMEMTLHRNMVNTILLGSGIEIAWFFSPGYYKVCPRDTKSPGYCVRGYEGPGIPCAGIGRLGDILSRYNTSLGYYVRGYLGGDA